RHTISTRDWSSDVCSSDLLFCDLVYVLAVTQLTRHLLANLTWRGMLEVTILLLAVWGAWIQITWITNYFDLGGRPARLVLIGLRSEEHTSELQSRVDLVCR